MNDISPLTPRADRPVDQITLLVIREIHKASRELGVQVFLVGATARIILLENVFGLSAGRVTMDMDFAFATEDWEQFNNIKQYLVTNSGFEESTRETQRLIFSSPEWKTKFVVDLIPFGGVEVKPNKIAWPPDMGVMMNVAGYSDALAAAVPVEVAPGLTIAVASLPGIAILKLFAWGDRGQENPKDAIDLVSLLRGYNEAGNESRIYEEEGPLAALEAVGYDVELAGAWLLGNDSAAMASAQTNAELRTLLEGVKRRRLVEDMARAMPGRDDALEYSQFLLDQFNLGFTKSFAQDKPTEKRIMKKWL